MAETGKSIGDADTVLGQCVEFEAELTALKTLYEQYFLGIERRPPTHPHSALKKKMILLRNTFVRQTNVKFRVQNLHSKMMSYERLWARTLQEIEDGTYRRDVYKAKRHRNAEQKAPQQKVVELAGDDDLDIEETAEHLAVPTAPAPPPKPVTAPMVKPVTTPFGLPTAKPLPLTAPVIAPVVAPLAPRPSAPKAPTPVPATASSGLSDGKIKAIYEAYVTAKKRCNEDTSKMSLDSVANSLKKQVPQLLKQHNAKSVEFKVVIKDGKAILRAVPKNE